MKVSLALSWLVSTASRLHLLSVSTSFFCSFTYSWRSSIRCFSSLATSSARHTVLLQGLNMHTFGWHLRGTQPSDDTCCLITMFQGESLLFQVPKHLTPVLNLVFCSIFIIAPKNHNMVIKAINKESSEFCLVRNAINFL